MSTATNNHERDWGTKIAIIVTWFGNLPPYFSAWLKSAEENKDVDFLVFCDHDIASKSVNIKSFKMTMEETLQLFEKKLGRSINIKNSYKFCDCRAFFGITYADYLKEYDFWGYCDIDLVFGNIREFLTDEVLAAHDRFYQYGHLCIFRNNYRINHLYDLPGGIYSLNEIFSGAAKTTPEEHFGLNRICIKNNIRWYTRVDFADFAIKYPQRLEVKHGLMNYSEQIFVWHQGRAIRFYRENGEVKQEEFVYMHWQKRKPTIDDGIEEDSYVVLTGDKLVVLPGDTNIETLDFSIFNGNVSGVERKKYRKIYTKKKLSEFRKADFSTKKMWMRQKFFKLIDGKQKYQ